MAADAVAAATAAAFAAPSPDGALQTRAAATELYRLAADILPPGALPAGPRLLTDGFDAEQIWTQLDLQLGVVFGSVRQALKRAQRAADRPEAPPPRENSTGGAAALHAAADGDENDDASDGAGTSDDNNDDGDDDDEGGDDEPPRSKRPARPAEDRFLNMDDMERFLEEAEHASARGADRPAGGDGDSEDDEEEEEGDGAVGGGGSEDDEAGIMYEDFFGRQASQDAGLSRSSRPRGDEPPIGGGSGRGGSDDEAEELEEDESESEPDSDEPPAALDLANASTHEKRAARIAQQVARLEEANLSTKTWTMRGEIAAGARPKNSVLEAELDFQHVARAAPVVTAESAASLEAMITARIIEGRFDDPVRVEAEVSAGPRTAVELDDKRSSKGLGELYEDDFLKAREQSAAPAAAQEDKRHVEAKALFAALCVKLDALSHFHFTPKPVLAELAIRPAVPALAMEELMPITVGAEATQGAAHELYASSAGAKKRAAAGGLEGEDEVNRARKRRRAKAASKAKGQAGGERKEQKKAGWSGPREKGAPSATTRAVFAQLQQEKEAGGKRPTAARAQEGERRSSAALKL